MATAEFWKWVLTWSAIVMAGACLIVMLIVKLFKNYEEERRIREEGSDLDPADFGSSRYSGSAH